MTAAKTILSSSEYSPRVIELRKKIHDASYVDYAVQRIALVLSRRLVEDDEPTLIQKGRMYGTQ